MTMAKIPRVPRKMEQTFGPEVVDEFIGFINDVYSVHKEDVVQLVSDRFDRRLSEEISVVKLMISDQSVKMTEMEFGLNSKIEEVGTGLNKKIDSLEIRMAGMDSRITEMQSSLDNRITEKSSGLDNRVTEMKSSLGSRITEVESSLDNRITEMKSSLDNRITDVESGLRVQIADFRSELKSDITGQTKWIAAIMIAVGSMISIVHPLMMKYL